MAEYYTQAVVLPEIPFDLLDNDTLTKLELCGFSYELTATGWFLYADEYVDEFEELLQEIIRRSEGQLSYLSVEGSYSCSEPFADAYGGFAYVITADDMEYVSTGLWLQDHIPWQEKVSQPEPPDSIRVDTYCSPLLNEWRMELHFGETVQVLDLEEADQLAETIQKQLTVYKATQQTTPVKAEEVKDQPMFW